MIHGSRSTFVNQRCRCYPCRLANARYQTPYKRMVRTGWNDGLRSPKKVNRMIKRLMLEGFTKDEIGRRMGLKDAPRFGRKIQARTERKFEEFFNYYIKEAA